MLFRSNLRAPIPRAGGHGGICLTDTHPARDLADGLAINPRLAVNLVLRDALAQQRLYRVPLLLRQDIHSCFPLRFRGVDDVLPCRPARRQRQPPMVSYWGILKWPLLGDFGWPPGFFDGFIMMFEQQTCLTINSAQSVWGQCARRSELGQHACKHLQPQILYSLSCSPYARR